MKPLYISIISILLIISSVSNAKPIKILCLGDSLTAGYGIDKANAFPALLQKELRKTGYKDAVVINAGISGSTTASGVGRLRWHTRAKDKPDILIIALGANDGLRGQDVSNAKTNLTKIIKLAKSNNIQVLLAGMLMPTNYGKQYTDAYKDIFPEVSKEHNIPLIPFLLQDVAMKKELNLADGIHPNESGHKVIMQTVMQHLVPLLGKVKP